MPIFKKKNKNGDLSINLQYIDGLPHYTEKTPIVISLNTRENILEIKAIANKIFNYPEVKLTFDRIIQYDIIDEKTILEKEKNMFGRAFIGTMLLGPAGTILGGISGIGKKKKNKNDKFLIINYGENIEDMKALTFKVVPSTYHLVPFIKALNEYAPFNPEKVKEMKEKLNISDSSEEKPKEIIL
ncbi:TPA: hypothetical protein ACGSDT_002855 [Clostridium perfringens]|nr:hypothetical protein [Clostridium perfringens]MDU3995165.1 hypothetical protein [Enterobacter sp.]EJT6483687.1 hypothetical protein [Clostridium perfringens]ELP5178138.1 hypothetical protein [Clostridium perfringens]BDA23747.1 hypothetical protein CPBEC1_29570 [Clostridium perfringens]